MNDQRKGGIGWTDFTANPIVYHDGADRVWACVKALAGCKNCYAESLAKRFDRGREFNTANMQKLAVSVDDKELHALLTSKKISGHRVFIGDMTDIFGEWVPFELLDKLFAVMALRPDVTFQILTKRPERMRQYVNGDGVVGAGEGRKWRVAQHAKMCENADQMHDQIASGLWPLPNVWLGTSVEDQPSADVRIPELIKTPAAVRFVSYEPALGPVNFGMIKWERFDSGGSLSGWSLNDVLASLPADELNPAKVGLDWVIVGGESGSGARPCDVAWIRSTVQQCEAAGVPVFVKQFGAHPVFHYENQEYPRFSTVRDHKGADPSEWPDDLRVQEFPR